jgi:transcriptional regulator with XRE-family HTH domain
MNGPCVVQPELPGSACEKRRAILLAGANEHSSVCPLHGAAQPGISNDTQRRSVVSKRGSSPGIEVNFSSRRNVSRRRPPASLSGRPTSGHTVASLARRTFVESEMSQSIEMPFGRRLRQERERRRIALSSIAANTKIGISLLEGLERGDVSRWPSGIFRRSFIRAYAEAIGLDPRETTAAFLELFPDPAESTSSAGEHSLKGSDDTVLRLTLADTRTTFVAGRLLARMPRRWAAVACDLGVFLAVGVMCFLAVGHFWMPLGLTMAAYYGCGIVLLGNTPGVCLMAPGAVREVAARPAVAPSSLREAFSRLFSHLPFLRLGSAVRRV